MQSDIIYNLMDLRYKIHKIYHNQGVSLTPLPLLVRVFPDTEL
jgi:hypothetical protein